MSTRPIDEALQRLDAVLPQCDAQERRTLLELARETRQRHSLLQTSVTEAREALEHLRLLQQRYSAFSQQATLQEAEHAAEMVDELLIEVSRQE